MTTITIKMTADSRKRRTAQALKGLKNLPFGMVFDSAYDGKGTVTLRTKKMDDGMLAFETFRIGLPSIRVAVMNSGVKEYDIVAVADNLAA